MRKRPDINLWKYLRILTNHGYSFYDRHWVREDDTYAHYIKTCLKDLFRYSEGLDFSPKLVKLCDAEGCMNPMHYRVADYGDFYKPNALEVSELTGLLESKKVLGLDVFLYYDMFNEGNPLPAGMVDFFYAYNQVRMKFGKKPIPKSVLKCEEARKRIEEGDKHRRELGLIPDDDDVGTGGVTSVGNWLME
jgi:hypothetical protein